MKNEAKKYIFQIFMPSIGMLPWAPAPELPKPATVSNLKVGDVVWMSAPADECVRIMRFEVKAVIAGKLTRYRLEDGKGGVATVMAEEVYKEHPVCDIFSPKPQLAFTIADPAETIKKLGFKIAK